MNRQEFQKSNKKKGKKKMNRGLKYTLISLLAILTVCLSIGGYAFSKISKITKPNSPSKRIDTMKYDEDYMVNFLLMGLDNDVEREATGLAGNRTDSMMLVSLNTKTQKATMYSIPRDTITVINNDERDFVPYLDTNATKVNAAFDLGEEEATVNTVEALFPGLEINYFWSFNFISFKELVDAIGGIDIDVPVDIMDWKLEKVLVPQGENSHLDGQQALDMARARYQDDDIQRGYRQQAVMQAIVDQMQKNISVTSAIKILDTLSDNVVTNMSITDITKLYGNAKDKDFEFNKIEAPWGSFDMGESSMVYLPADSRYKVVKSLNDELGRETLSENLILNGENDLQFTLNQLEKRIVYDGQLEFSVEEINELFSDVLGANAYDGSPIQ